MKRKVIAAVMTIVFMSILALSLQSDSMQPKKQSAVSASKDLPGWKQHASEPVTLDWYVNYSWFTSTWGENLVSKAITDETGVNINFIHPSGNEREKLNALISSDSLPDLITLGWWEPQISEMIQKNMVYALNELADRYDVYFWKVSEPDRVSYYTQEDGNIYGYPNSSYAPNDLKEHDNIGSNQTFLVRKDIYQAIGSPDMTTIEGFKAAVEKAQTMFPEVEGEPLIPIGAHVFNNTGNVSFDEYLMDFLAVPYEKDGVMYDRYTDPDYIAWLKMFRDLGQEGLLKNDIFLDQRTQMEEKLAKGRYFCMLYQYTDLLAQQKELYVNNPDSIYMAVDGPKNAKRDKYALPISGMNGWTVTLISKNCAHPDRAIEFMDYLMSEHGQLMTYLGVEGKTYDMVDGKPVIKPEVRDVLNTDRRKYDKLYGADDTYWMLQNNVMQLQWKQKSADPIAQLEQWSYPYAIYNGQYKSILQPKSKEEYEDMMITNLWGKTLPELLLADSQEKFNQILADFVQKRKALGYDSVQQMKTTFMKDAKNKLGFK